MTYKLTYQNGEYELNGFKTVAEAVAEAASWGDDEPLAITENFDGSGDNVINETTGEIVCCLVNKAYVCDKFDLQPGESFMAHLMNIGTYSQDELNNLE